MVIIACVANRSGLFVVGMVAEMVMVIVALRVATARWGVAALLAVLFFSEILIFILRTHDATRLRAWVVVG